VTLPLFLQISLSAAFPIPQTDTRTHSNCNKEWLRSCGSGFCAGEPSPLTWCIVRPIFIQNPVVFCLGWSVGPLSFRLATLIYLCDPPPRGGGGKGEQTKWIKKYGYISEVASSSDLVRFLYLSIFWHLFASFVMSLRWDSVSQGFSSV
jgi:hypothetical protein